MFSTKNQILNEVDQEKKVDCILVLGAGLNGKNKPSPMLKERLDEGIRLYKEGLSDKIIVSGDHAKPDYDEVNVMKSYILESGIPSIDIFMDHAGLSTYDSVYRAKEIFEVSSMIIVTQKYHLYRALYIANSLGVESLGMDAQKKLYSGQNYRDTREFLARIKDFFKVMLKPKSTYVGETISVFKDGRITDDKEYIFIKDIDTSKEKYLDKKDLDDVKDMVNSLIFEEKNCKEKEEYKLVISDDKAYGLEIDDKIVHVTYEDREAILNKENSKTILDLLYR